MRDGDQAHRRRGAGQGDGETDGDGKDRMTLRIRIPPRGIRKAILTRLAADSATLYDLFRLGRPDAVNRAVAKLLEAGEIERVEHDSVVGVRLAASFKVDYVAKGEIGVDRNVKPVVKLGNIVNTDNA